MHLDRGLREPRDELRGVLRLAETDDEAATLELSETTSSLRVGVYGSSRSACDSSATFRGFGR
jgi:hypothetical protein